MLLTVRFTGTLVFPAELRMEIEPGSGLAGMGSAVTVMVAGVVGTVVCDTCSHETDGTRVMLLMGAPLLVRLRLAEACTLTCAEILRGLGLILSVWAYIGPMATNVRISTLRLEARWVGFKRTSDDGEQEQWDKFGTI
jgi:hypothetical protein